MDLFIKNDLNFTIDKPYIYFQNLDVNKVYDIYTDGSYIRLGKDSFCCVGGVVIEHDSSKKIGEFFAPLNTKNSLEQHTIPCFKQTALNTALLIQDKYNLKIFNIYTDSLTDISKYHTNNKIKWISKKENIADEIVLYCKNKWKEKNKNSIQSFKIRNNLFNDVHDKNIFIISYSKPSNCLYYFFAINEEKEIIDYIKFNKPNDFGALDLIIKMLKNDFRDCNFNISKNMFNKIKNYVKGDLSYEIESYENFFNVIEKNHFNLKLKPSTQDICPKKKNILNHLGFK